MVTSLDARVEVILKPGELYVTNRPMIIKTLLGSCVFLALFSNHKKLAALPHA